MIKNCKKIKPYKGYYVYITPHWLENIIGRRVVISPKEEFVFFYKFLGQHDLYTSHDGVYIAIVNENNIDRVKKLTVLPERKI